MKNQAAVESRSPSCSSVAGALRVTPTASTSATAAQPGSRGRRAASSQTATAPQSSAAMNALARGMPRSYSSPAARTSGASGPSASMLPGRKRQGSEPSSGRLMATSANSTPTSTQAPRAPSSSLMPRLRAGANARPPGSAPPAS